MAAPAIRSSATFADTVNTTSRTIANPAGATTGDWYVLQVSIDASAAITTPTGFTSIYNRVTLDSSECRMALFTRKYNGSEGATFTIATDSEIACGGIACISGADSTQAVDVFSDWMGTPDSQDAEVLHPCPAAYASYDDSLIMRIAASDNGSTVFTDPGSQTNIWANIGASSSGSNISACYATQAGAGYVGAVAFTSDSSTENGFGITLIIKSSNTPATLPAQPIVKSMSCYTGDSSATAPMTYLKPYGTADGDTLLMIQAIDVASILDNPPTNFTNIQTGNNSTLVYMRADYKIASSEGSSYTGSATTTNANQGALLRITGAHATTPINTSSSPATGTGTAPAATTITPSVNNCLLFMCMASDDDEIAFDTGAPTSYSPVFAASTEESLNVGLGIYRLAQTTAAATGTVTGSITASEEWVAFSFAIAPAATGIAYDAASNSGYQASSSSYSWSHTCTGSDRYLTVGVAMLSLAQSVSGITYNSVAMTLIGSQASVTGAARVELWGLVAPTTGSNTIAVTLSGSIASAGCASSYTGVQQTSPIEGFNSAQATNVGAADATVAVTTVADNDWCVDIVCSDDTAITVGAGQTQTGNVTGAGGSGAMSYEGPKTPAGAVTMSWANVAALATWAIGAVALRPVAASNLTVFVPRVMFY